MTLPRETLVDLNHQLAGFSLSGDRRNSDTRFAIKEASSALADLRHELADFSSPSFRPNSDARRILVKEAAENRADLRQDIAIARKESGCRVMARTVADFGRTLAEFSLAPGASPLFEIKRSPNGTKIKGYVSTFGVLDAQDEIVDPGAFAASLAAHRRAGSQIKMLWQHDTHEICGLWTSLAEDSKGLFGEGLLLDSIQRGKEAIALLDAGAELGSSIGFRAVRDRVINKVRHLQEVDLLEISLVTFASSPGTRMHLATKEYGNRSDAKILVDLERASDFSLARFG